MGAMCLYVCVCVAMCVLRRVYVSDCLCVCVVLVCSFNVKYRVATWYRMPDLLGVIAKRAL